MIFEDDEKDNNEFDASINSDDTDGISWDDLIDENSENIDVVPELEINHEAENIRATELTDGLEGITEGNSDDEVVENDLDNFADLDMLEDQNEEPVIEESVSMESADDIIYSEDNNDIQPEINYELEEPQDINQEQPPEEINLNDGNVDNFDQVPNDINVSLDDHSDMIGIASLNSSNDEKINIDGFAPESSVLASKNDDNRSSVALGIVMATILVLAIVGVGAFILVKNGGNLTSIFNRDSNSNQDIEDVSLNTDFNDMNDLNAPQQEPEKLIENNSSSSENLDNTSSQASVSQGKQDVSKSSAKEEKVVVSVVHTGRANPFSPTGNISQAGYTVPTLGNLAPPSDLVEDEELGKLVDIVCTGILYDNVKPSAIITVGGVDYFVQKGDRVDKFIVSAITPTSVVIRNGTNSYVATIGQEFDIGGTTPGKMNYVYNGKSKPVTRQYLSPQEIEIKVK